MDSKKVNEIIRLATKWGMFAHDVEFEPNREDGEEVHYYDPDFDIHGCSFAVKNDQGDVVGVYLTERDEIQAVIDGIFNDEIEAYAHYAKVEHQWLTASGYVLPVEYNIRCTAVALNLFDEDRMFHGLKKITPEFLNYEMMEFSEASDNGFDTEKFRKYAAEDSIATLRLAIIFKERLLAANLWEVYSIVAKTAIVFSDMERFGMYWDMEVSSKLQNKILELERELEEKIWHEVGWLEINSNAQVAARLFGELGMRIKNPDRSKTTGKISVNESNLSKLAEKYPVCEQIMAYRTCGKMISTYIDAFSFHSAFNSDNRVHARFGQLLLTGRTNCVDPALQTVPNDLSNKIKFDKDLKESLSSFKIRSGFTAPEGKVMIVRDYSSLEYRTAAIAAPEPKLISMYRFWECDSCGKTGSTAKVVRHCEDCSCKVSQGKDLHQRNADIANRNGANTDRQGGKGISFLSIFCGGAWKLSKLLSVQIPTAEKILKSVFDEFKGFKKWHKNSEVALNSSGEVRDMFGRRRRVNLKQVLSRTRAKGIEDGLDSKQLDRKVLGSKKNLLNLLVNFTAQSPACIIGQVAMQKFRKRMISEGLWGLVELVNFVHDEIVLLSPVDIAEYVNTALIEAMEQSVDIGVPLPTEGGVLWGSLKKDENGNWIGKAGSWSDCK